MDMADSMDLTVKRKVGSNPKYCLRTFFAGQGRKRMASRNVTYV